MIVFYYCTNEHGTLFWSKLCRRCGAPMVREIQCIPKGEGTKLLEQIPALEPEIGEVRPHPWRLTRHDWAVCKALWVDPEQERPIFGA